VHEETLTGQPHDTSVHKSTSDNENVDAVQRYALDITRCGCSLTSCPGPREEKKRAAEEIKLLKTKKAKLTTAVTAEAQAIDLEIAVLEKTTVLISD